MNKSKTLLKQSRTTRKAFKIPEFLEQNEYARYLKAIRRRAKNGIRNYAMIRVMAEVGLRCDELTGLKLLDIDWSRQTIKVTGKGRRERILGFNSEVEEAMKAWHLVRPNSNYFFCNRKGGKTDNRSVRFFVAMYGKKAQLAKKVHPHMLRHTFATHLYRQTKDLAAVQRALGHKHINNTMIYTHIVDDDVQEAMQSFKLKP